MKAADHRTLVGSLGAVVIDFTANGHAFFCSLLRRDVRVQVYDGVTQENWRPAVAARAGRFRCGVTSRRKNGAGQEICPAPLVDAMKRSA